jgi:hypothetical protein
MDHLLDCDVSYAIWIVFFSRFGLPQVMPRHVVNLHACWLTTSITRSAAVWNIVPTSLL